MTPSARVQAAIEILDEVIASARDNGPPADQLVTRYFKSRRYAGSKDRRAVRETVFRAIRAFGTCPKDGRSAILGLGEWDALFDGSGHGPAGIGPIDEPASPSLLPDWLVPELSPLVGEAEWPALLERAPLDLRVNVARTERDVMASSIEGAVPTTISPWGLRLPPDSKIDETDAFNEGLVEVQDEGSQLIALACAGGDGKRLLDLCAGAGGKALALAAAAPGATIVATDTNRARLSQLAPRAARAGAAIDTRLLDGGREAAQLAEWEGQFDCVLVDAPCSGSGTWRRNPEGRWRLTLNRLADLEALQRHVLDLAAPLVRPGGALVYATCSILSREGSTQAAAFLGRYSGWTVQDVPQVGGRMDGPGRLLTPAHDGTDGFFVARLVKPC